MHNRIARETWTPRPKPLTYERFLSQALADANEAQFEELLVTATRADLQDIARDLRKRLQGATFAARLNGDTIRALWRRDRG